MKPDNCNSICYLFMMICDCIFSAKLYATNQSQNNLVELKLRNICYPASDPCVKDIWNLYQQREQVVKINTHQIALILIDIWQEVDKITSHDQENNFVINKIVPVLKAARDADLVVIHAPHRNVTTDGIRIDPPISSELHRSKDKNELLADQKLLQKHEGKWPPIEFFYRCGEYTQFDRNVFPSYMIKSYVSGIHEAVRPIKRKREYIESNLSKVYQILEQEGILHLVYVGFATNECVFHRPVGVRDMSRHGFNEVLLRDATLGTERADISITHKITEGAILNIEKGFGFSATSEDFIHAIRTSQGR